MNRLKFLRVVYLMPVIMLAFWPMNVNCSQCGDVVLTESFAARIASGFEKNFICGLECAQDYLDANPLMRDANGDIIRRTGQ